MSVRKFSTASILSPSYKNSRFWDGVTFDSSWDSIASVTAVGGAGSSVIFNNIPPGYKILRWHIQCATNDNNVRSLQFIINDDIGTVYSAHAIYQQNGTMNYANNTSQQGGLLFAQTSAQAGMGAAATYWSAFVLEISDYTSTSKNKTASGWGGYTGDGTNGAFGFGSSSYISSNPITKISFQPTFASGVRAGSTFCLYGIK